MEKKIFEIVMGCPVCRGALKGNPEMNYFCSTCNIVYTEKEASHSPHVTIIEEEDDDDLPEDVTGPDATNSDTTTSIEEVLDDS